MHLMMPGSRVGGEEEGEGESLFDCHNNSKSVERIKMAYEGIKKNGKEVFVTLTSRNQRVYMQGVRDSKGNWIGFIERFELNLQIDNK